MTRLLQVDVLRGLAIASAVVIHRSNDYLGATRPIMDFSTK
jgi:hypothetical protein